MKNSFEITAGNFAMIPDCQNIAHGGARGLASLFRKTRETDISMRLNIAGSGQCSISSGIGFLNHLLELFAFWAKFDLELKCVGDVDVDAHHTVEDCGFMFGKTLLEALGDRRGIRRAAWARVPMDEALAEIAVDLSGRAYLVWRDADLLPPVIAREEKDVWREFFRAFATGCACNLHIDFRYGSNGHHLLESAAKGCGLAFGEACAIVDDRIISTKGKLDL